MLFGQVVRLSNNVKEPNFIFFYSLYCFVESLVLPVVCGQLLTSCKSCADYTAATLLLVFFTKWALLTDVHANNTIQYSTILYQYIANASESWLCTLETPPFNSLPSKNPAEIASLCYILGSPYKPDHNKVSQYTILAKNFFF